MKTNYTVSTDCDGFISDHATLYQALKAMPKTNGANVIGPKGDRRLVAFFDGWRNLIAVGGQATDAERALIVVDAGLLAA